MTKLLKCQEEALFNKVESEWLYAFSIALLCSLLEIFEQDLTTEESSDIRRFVKDWLR